ncbi:substrate-binding periplasmic protein [Pseudoalteromonas rubra]|uniref:Uncharacterized protein n=1 Tax=Pseudoalteromonas rubra TaxID=43658 RepID=A0A0U2XW83_9GAMM|nr:transporter substrate-binding domain-containing protein [Pseudoalteromonas rubra]ALU42306.1 hypothetical protein AT705_04715 [Pseudoalteromonas rubra]
MLHTIGYLLISYACVLANGIFAQDESLSVYTEHFAPYTIAEPDHRLSGSAVSIVNQALALAGLETDIKVIPWARAYEIALSQPNVLLFSMAKTQERAALFHWLYRITTLKYDFYSLHNKQVELENITDALSYTTVAIRGSYEESKLISLGFTEADNLVLVANMERAWQMLNKGRVHTIFASHVPVKVISQIPTQYIRHQAINDQLSLYVVASLSTEPVYINALTRAFEQLEMEYTANSFQGQ